MDKKIINLDEFIPHCLTEYTINLEVVEKLKKLFNSKNLVNLIFHGVNGSGKYTLVLALLSYIYDNTVYSKKKNEIVLEEKHSKKTQTIEVYSSSYHYELDAIEYSMNENNLICLFINNICKNYNINNKYHIILIKNAQVLSKNNQIQLKGIIEKYYSTCRLILLFNKISGVDLYLKSQFLEIRVPLPKKSEICELAYKIINDYNVPFTIDDFKKLIKYVSCDLYKLTFKMQQIIINGGYIEDMDYIEKKLKDLIKLIKKKCILENKLIKIREELLQILLNNYPPTLMFEYIISGFSKEKNYTSEQKMQIIHYGAEFELRCCEGYRQLYHIEAFIAKIILIIESY